MRIHNKIYRIIRFLGSLSTILLISGCAVYKTGFECSPGRGEGCKSVTQVNEMISRGEIGRNITVWQQEEQSNPQQPQIKENKIVPIIASTKQPSVVVKQEQAKPVNKTKKGRNQNSDSAEKTHSGIKNIQRECACSKQ